MFDLKELTRWVEVTDKGVRFPNEVPRKIRLEVLAEKEESLYIKDGKDKPFYIGTFHGYDVVQFNVQSDCSLQATGAGVKVFTTEFQSEVIELPDAVSFTRLVQRRVRNPELEMIEHKMRQNMERRLRQVEKDVTLRVSQRMREENAKAERERFERATKDEESRIVVESDEDEGADGAAPGDVPSEASSDVSRGGGKAKGQKLAPKPKA